MVWTEKEGMDVEEDIRQLKGMVEKSHRIVFFGGAGVSTESGIPDFRSSGGLYSQKYKYPPEQVVSHTFFISHTEEFFEFYRDRMMFLDARPNAAHEKLAKWEKEGELLAVVTQNIDGLHQLAGSRHVLELHGSIHRNYCMQCGKFYDAGYIKNAGGIPHCECGGIIKPDVVLYEEQLDAQVIRESIRAIEKADMLIIGGTSLVVYPAAGFIDYFKGKYMVVINKSATVRDVHCDLCIQKPIGEVLGQL